MPSKKTIGPLRQGPPYLCRWARGALMKKPCSRCRTEEDVVSPGITGRTPMLLEKKEWQQTATWGQEKSKMSGKTKRGFLTCAVPGEGRRRQFRVNDATSMDFNGEEDTAGPLIAGQVYLRTGDDAMVNAFKRSDRGPTPDIHSKKRRLLATKLIGSHFTAQQDLGKKGQLAPASEGTHSDTPRARPVSGRPVGWVGSTWELLRCHHAVSSEGIYV